MLNTPGPAGDTPLHRAAHWGHSSMVELLVQAGAGAEQINDAGLRPFDVICRGRERLLALPTITKLLRAPAAAA